MVKPKTAEEQEHIDNLISIRDDLWSGEKTREEPDKEKVIGFIKQENKITLEWQHKAND